MEPTAEARKLAHYLVDTLGGEPTVDAYWDEAERQSIDILLLSDVPDQGVSTIATLGLCDVDIDLQVNGKSLRTEIIMAHGSDWTDGSNILATCALNVINDQKEIMPGAVHLDVVAMYLPESDMQHILFAHPFTWSLKSQDFPNVRVAWLQAIPISQAELAYYEENGFDELEKLLEEAEVDVYDLMRGSTI